MTDPAAPPVERSDGSAEESADAAPGSADTTASDGDARRPATGEEVTAEGADDEASFAEKLQAYPRLEAWLGRTAQHALVRFLLLRLLGFVYVAAFLSLCWQLAPLIGSQGILPAHAHVGRAIASLGSPWSAFVREPSLFYLLTPSDAVLSACAGVGLALSLAVLCGVSNALVMFALFVLYRSFIAVGQLWYGYGWELLLVESGFLACFLCPLKTLRALPPRAPPLAVIWLFRWLAFRVMFGAGLIKLRGDSCWRDLTCLDFHFETQPLPNPVSPLLHALPHGLLASGVVFNHVAELLLPLCIFGPRKLRIAAALGMMAFQLILIVSGNLSFLNWLTIVPLLACLDDRFVARFVPQRLRERARDVAPPARGQVVTAALLSALILLLSSSSLANMFSRRQRMNAAFEPLMIVNSYGAFGSVGRERRELIIEGTRDEPTPDARWLAYEFPFKPGDPERPLGVISPLQPRLDWQLWFAAMSSAEDEPWLLHLVWKLLHADRGLRRLLSTDPFGDEPPRYVRIMRYRYRFAPLGAKSTWKRELEGYWLPPLPADEILREAMVELGYVTAD